MNAGEPSAGGGMLDPLIFLDLDDVLVLKRHPNLGGYEVADLDAPSERWRSLLHQPAVETLAEAVQTHSARIILTTTWLRFMGRLQFERLFRETGFPELAKRIHPCWSAPQKSGETRASAIQRWLETNHNDEPFVILDDERSGTGLRPSKYFDRGQVVLCEVGVGLHRGHLVNINKALTR